MSPPAARWSRLKSLFEAASELPADERASFVRALPPEDDALCEELLSLLAAHDEESQFVERAIGAEQRDLARAADFEPAGRRVGAWEIVRPLGRGGMGEVYLAVRADDAFRKKAALKLLRPGLASPEAAGRFRAERQVLAGLEHPSIARLLDGGTDDRGLPHLVMEYVDGEPIDVYCDRAGLELPARLEIFSTVCGAVATAHRSLVVHRDLKPSNILVTAQGEVKLLDFGIAKILGGSLAQGEALETRAGRPLMTLAYASPEQIRGGAVTTATDVYGLGVLLYRLLTGRHPHRLDGNAWGELERAICEDDAKHPSVAILRGHERALDEDSDPSTTGRTERLARRLRGDLDLIALTALSKDPARRYASAEVLREEIERYLAGLPIRARPDSVTYRARKFVARHQTGVAAGGLVALSLASGVAATLWQASKARRKAKAAQQAQAEAEQMSGFLRRTLSAVDATWHSRGTRVGADVTVAQVLDEAAARIGDELGDRPQVEAALRQTLAQSYAALGLYEKAEAQARVGLGLETAGMEGASRRRGELLRSLAEIRRLRGDYDEAEALHREAIDVFERRSDQGAVGADQGAVGSYEVLQDLALLLWQRGRIDEAEELMRDSADHYRQRADGPKLAIVLGNLGLLRDGRGDLEGAATFYQEALDTFAESPGRERPERAWSLINLGQVRKVQGRYAEAETLLQESIAVWGHTVGTNHPNAAQSYVHLAHTLSLAGRPLEAEPTIVRALDILRPAVGDDHPDIANAETIKGLILLRAERYAEAEAPLRHALAVRRSAYLAGDWRTASTAGILGECLLELGRLDECLPLVKEAEAGLRAKLGDKHPRTIEARARLARLEARRRST